jgi:hypothetical protein
MKTDLIRVKYEGEVILTIEGPILADKFISSLLTFDSEMTTVTLTYDDSTKRKAKKFVLNQLGGMVIPSIGLNLLFPKGTIIYVFK